jgi:hypothetical protein
MATKKTARKKATGAASGKRGAKQVETALAALKAPPPKSDKDLTRWVLDKLLGEMVSKLLSGEELKFASNDILRVIQTIREYDGEDERNKVSGIRVEWVEPKQP